MPSDHCAGLIERIVRALEAAGIDISPLDPNARNTVRTAIRSAFLVSAENTEISPAQGTAGSSALPGWRLERVLKYVDDHIADKISLSDLAAAAGMSRMYFAGQFRASTGVRPHDYVLGKRIARARALLAATGLSLVEVSFNCGFQTQAHFTTVFRKLVGQTPLVWRRTHAIDPKSIRCNRERPCERLYLSVHVGQ